MRSRLRPALALGALVFIAVVALLVWERGTGREEGPRSGSPSAVSGREPGAASPTSALAPERLVLRGRATLARRGVFFGDTVEARIDVLLDRRRVDPDSVRIRAPFSPWEVAGAPARTRRDAGSATHLRTTYVLRCLTSPCIPTGQASPLEFSAARITYAEPGAGPEAARESMRVGWPVLTVYSRFASASFEGREGLSTPWRADAQTLSAATHRIAPGLLLGLLLVGGGLLAAGGVALVFLAWPRRAPAPPPEPEAPPPPPLPPLLQALVLLEDAARADGAEDRRRALELVAEVLREHGDSDLARSARALAWSEHDPEVEDTTGLAARVRSTLELEEEPLEEETNGRVV